MTSLPLKYFGGKQHLAKWIISHLPPRDGDRPWHLWREPFFGGGAVTFGLDPEGLSEAVNDLDKGLTNFWQMLRSPAVFSEFYDRLKNTPFSEVEWNLAVKELPQWLDTHKFTSALLFFVKFRQSRQGLGKDFATPTSRLRRGMNENVSAWLSAVEGLPAAHERLKRIEIRNMDACEFIRKYDHEAAVFYCDPPYMPITRTATNAYTHEMTEEDHEKLLKTLTHLKGRFLLSGYETDLYNNFANNCGWNVHKKESPNHASSKLSKRLMTECLWTNYP